MRDNPLQRAFQDRLETLRHKHGLSRKDFADRPGIPHTSYATLLAHDANPTLGTIGRIAGRVRLDPKGMFGDGRQVAPDPQTEAG